MKIIKFFVLLGLLLTFVISCKESPTIYNPPPLGDEGGDPYEPPENLIVEIESVVGEHIYLKDNSALVAGDSLYTINLDDINNPEVVSVLKLPNRAIGLTVHNNLAFVSIDNGHFPNSGTGGLQIVDITDISNPKFIGFYKSSYRIFHVAVKDSIVFLAMLTSYPAGELQIINIANIENPELIKQLEYEKAPRSISISNNMAYITFYENELKIFDISNPTEPKVVSENNLLGFNNIHTTIGSKEYLVTIYISDKIYLIDVSNPENPEKQSETNSYAHILVARDNLIYLGSGNGIEVLDINNGNLNFVSSFDTNGIVESFSVKDNYVLAMVAIADTDTILFPRFQIFRYNY